MIQVTGPETNRSPVTMTVEPLSPEEQAKDQDRHARFMKNMAWYQAHATDIGRDYGGKYICIAGEQLFFGDDPTEIYTRARAAFPDDWGAFFTKYVHARR